MSQFFIVADTGSLITLEKLPEGYTFLRKLYGKILIPSAVAEEISQKCSHIQEYLELHKVDDFIEIREIKPPIWKNWIA